MACLFSFRWVSLVFGVSARWDGVKRTKSVEVRVWVGDPCHAGREKRLVSAVLKSCLLEQRAWTGGWTSVEYMARWESFFLDRGMLGDEKRVDLTTCFESHLP